MCVMVIVVSLVSLLDWVQPLVLQFKLQTRPARQGICMFRGEDAFVCVQYAKTYEERLPRKTKTFVAKYVSDRKT